MATQTTTNQTYLSEKKKATWWQVWKGMFNFWLDVAMFVTIIFVVWVSVLMQVVFPPATSADGWKLWGLAYNQWRDMQFFALCVFAVLAIEHLVLHWNWVCSMIATKLFHCKRPDEGTQAIFGVGTLVVILLLSMITIIAAILSVKEPYT